MKVRCENRETASVWRVYLDPTNEEGEVVLDGDGLSELSRLIDEANESPKCRVITLQSNGGVFCRGMDLRFLTAHAGEDLSRRVRAYAQCMRQLRECKRAVVCVVDGDAMGGGVGLAAASDHVVGTARASFAFPEAVLGLVPAMVLPLLMQRVPPQKARWLALSGSSLKAQEAHRLGLVDQLVEGPIEAEKALRQVIKRLLRANPRSVAKVKRFAAEVTEMECGEALLAGADHTSKDLLELETIAAIRGFLAGESPPWFERYKPRSGD